MRRIKKILSTVLIAVVALCAAPSVWAAGTTVSTNRSALTVGQTVTATVTFSGTMAAVQFTVNYSPSVLRYESYSSSSDLTVNATSGVVTSAVMTSNGANASSIRCSFTFTALATGSSALSVYVNDCIDEEGNPVVCADGSATVTVNASTVAPPSSSQSSESSSQAPEVETDPITVTVDGVTKHILRSLVGIEIPEEFETGEDEYAGEMVEVARGIDQDMLLMYLTNADGTGGGFYRYIRSEDRFYPFYRIVVNASRYTVIAKPDQVSVPIDWEPVMMEYGDQLIPAYYPTSQTDALFLVYASNGKGDTGFYLFDPVEGTMQRYVGGDATVNNPDAVTDARGSFFERLIADRAIFVTMCVSWALVVLIAGAWLVFYLARATAHVSDQKRKDKEEKVTRKLEKRAARAAKKNKVDLPAPEIGSLDEDLPQEEPAADDESE